MLAIMRSCVTHKTGETLGQLGRGSDGLCSTPPSDGWTHFGPSRGCSDPKLWEEGAWDES